MWAGFSQLGPEATSVGVEVYLSWGLGFWPPSVTELMCGNASVKRAHKRPGLELRFTVYGPG